MHKRWKIWNTSFQYICQKTQIYTQLVEFTFKHIVSKSMQKPIQHERKVSSRRCFPSMFTTISLTYHLFWRKKEKKENKYKVEKHHICTTQWHQYTPSLILKKNTYTTILLEDCTIKQGKIKLKFQENQKITRKLERKSLNWKRVSLRWLWIKRDWNLREKI